MVTIRIIQDVVMAPPEDSADIPPAATKEELNDLEKDLHSINLGFCSNFLPTE